MSPPADVRGLLEDLADVLSKETMDWYVFGAQAVQVWGIPRLSADVDVTVDLGERDPRALVGAMVKGGFDLRVTDSDDFVGRTRVLPFVHARSGIPLDVVLAGPGPEQEFLSRAQVVPIAGLRIPVISAEDLIITKVLAGRPKDAEDVRGILRTRLVDLDMERVRDFLRALEEALGQSDLVRFLDEQVHAVRR